MSRTVHLVINGATVDAVVEPRLHLADFLREQRFLTGTHLGCEHGVCGACTILIDGAPARSCIAFAAACDGARIETIEGLEHDPVMVRLRAAFTAEHALQCGYCTPGMLVTARDIVLRLPQADEARVRLELAGNLCRCTGYTGIVRAILSVLAETAAPSPLVGLSREADQGWGGGSARPDSTPPPPTATLPHKGGGGFAPPDGEAMTQRLRIAAPLEAVWQAVQNPALIAGCVPGARLTEQTGDEIAGELALSLGPMQARFAGRATLGFGPGHAGWVRGEGRDGLSGTRLSAQADFSLQADGAATVLVLDVRYTLRGPLAQFARGAVVNAFAAEIAETVGANLAAKLAGTAPPPPSRLGLGRLFWAVLRRWLRL
jgi:carbon-monoxide dehydrogenase small subunit